MTVSLPTLGFGAGVATVLVALFTTIRHIVVTKLKGAADVQVAEVNRGVIRGRDGEIQLVLPGDLVLQVALRRTGASDPGPRSP